MSGGTIGKWTSGENNNIEVIMVRTITDNPGGWSRSLPGHTVEYEPSFAQPFYYGTSIVLGAGKSGTYTLTFADAAHIFFIDMVNITPQAYKELNAIVEVNDVPYVAASGIGWLNLPLRQNPSIQLIAGDKIDVIVNNQDASTRTMLIKIQGTKIVRPANFGHAPSAYWTANYHSRGVGQSVTFTDGTGNSPTSWEWDFGDGSDPSTEQNPTHTYAVAGSFYPRLKAGNVYGYDFYAESTPVVVS